MTIEFKNVTKKVRNGPVKVDYLDLNIRIDETKSVALLAQKSAGVDSIVDLLCGADAPDNGHIVRSHSISWAIPSPRFLHKHHSLAANARFLARLYEIDEREYLAKIAEAGDLGPHLNTRADKCPKDALSLFCFLAGAVLPFDQYIFTSVTAGGKANRERVADTIESLRARAGLLIVSQNPKLAKQFCDVAYVFDQGQATYFDDMDAAAEFFGAIGPEAGEEEIAFEDEAELESLVNVDF
jgi:capsular polysaccharide transport system ATP-binding protein